MEFLGSTAFLLRLFSLTGVSGAVRDLDAFGAAFFAAAVFAATFRLLTEMRCCFIVMIFRVAATVLTLPAGTSESSSRSADSDAFCQPHA